MALLGLPAFLAVVVFCLLAGILQRNKWKADNKGGVQEIAMVIRDACFKPVTKRFRELYSHDNRVQGSIYSGNKITPRTYACFTTQVTMIDCWQKSM